MTGNYDIALPALVTSILAVVVASSIEPESIDTLGLARAGRSLRPPREQIMDLIPVSAAFHQAVEPIPAHAPVAEILRLIGESRATSFPVLDTEQRLVGTISVHDIRRLLVDPAATDVLIAHALEPQTTAYSHCLASGSRAAELVATARRAAWTSLAFAFRTAASNP